MRFILTTLTLAITLTACKKDHSDPVAPDPVQPVVYDDYFQAKPGNYWIYQHFMLDSAGQHLLNEYDSIWVVSDTVMGGFTYHRFDGRVLNNNSVAFHPLSYSRDSLHYVVYQSGGIVLSSQLFDTVFRTAYQIMFGDTSARVDVSMSGKDSLVTTPAGTFSTITALYTWHMYPGFQNGGATRYTFERYAKDIGLVEEVRYFYFSSPGSSGRTLVRYHLEP